MIHYINKVSSPISCLIDSPFLKKIVFDFSVKICITSGFEKECEQLDKESPEVECLRVQDSVECAKILRGGTVGFGIFSAESMVLLAALNYSELNVLKELRHLDRLNRKYDDYVLKRPPNRFDLHQFF